MSFCLEIFRALLSPTSVSHGELQPLSQIGLNINKMSQFFYFQYIFRIRCVETRFGTCDLGPGLELDNKFTELGGSSWDCFGGGDYHNIAVCEPARLLF